MADNPRKLADWANARDGVIATPDAIPQRMRVIPYDEVARRLEERPKK